MTDRLKSDALVFFWMSGDLAYKKIFPALQALVRRGKVDGLVVGVSRSPWTTEQLVERARSSIVEHSHLDPVAFPKLASLFRHVSGDYADPEMFVRLRGGPCPHHLLVTIDGERRDFCGVCGVGPNKVCPTR